MSEPMSDERLAEIRVTAARFTSDSMLPELLAETDRLRAAVARVTDDRMWEASSKTWEGRAHAWMGRALKAEQDLADAKAALAHVTSFATAEKVVAAIWATDAHESETLATHQALIAVVEAAGGHAEESSSM